MYDTVLLLHNTVVIARGSICICGGAFLVNITSENRRFDAGFRNGGERGASAAKQKLKPSGSSDWISGRGLAVRFGPASWSALVIEFCQQSGFYRLPKKFLQRCVFLLVGEGSPLPGELPSRCVFKRCICWEPSVLRKPENSGADASHIPALNTSSTSALRCFRTFRQQGGSPANTDLYIWGRTRQYFWGKKTEGRACYE